MESLRNIIIRQSVRNIAQCLKALTRQALDDSIFMNILSRLSVKSICSYKTVCKSWNGFLSEDYFAKKQLEYSRENPAYIVCPSFNERAEFYSMTPGSLELSPLNKIDPAERSKEYSMDMISSFNGLICCINEISDDCDVHIWICNPCTGETLLLPQGTPSYEVEPIVGVAYASDTSDYTVFRMFSTRKKLPEGEVADVLVFECQVYSSTTGSWKNIGLVPHRLSRAFNPNRSCHVFVGGKIYWLDALAGRGEILCVDLEGTFDVIRLPPYEDHLSLDNAIPRGIYLIALRGSLSLLILIPAYMGVMRWQEETKDWVDVYDVTFGDIPFADIVIVMSSHKNEVICLTPTESWSYNMDTEHWDNGERLPHRIWDNFGDAPYEDFFPRVFPFTESVLTCKGGVML